MTLANSRRSASVVGVGRRRAGGVLAVVLGLGGGAQPRSVSASSACAGELGGRLADLGRRARSGRRGGSAPPRSRAGGHAGVGGGAEVRVGADLARARSAPASGRGRGGRATRGQRRPARLSRGSASADKRASRISARSRQRKREALEPVLEARRDRRVVEAAGEDRALADAGLGRGAVGLAGEERGRGRRRRRRAACGARARRGRGAASRRARRPRRRREERGAAGADLALPVGAERGVGDAGEMGAQPGVERGAALGAVEDLALGLAGPDAGRRSAARRRGAPRIAAAPPARTTSSGSWPGGISAKRSERPGPSSGSARSISRWAAARPAASPSSATTGSGASFQSAASWCLGDRGAERRPRRGRGRPGRARSRPCSPRRRSTVPALRGGGAGGADVVERAALVEERRVGRVQVLRLLARRRCARAPKAMARPRASRIGKMIRPRKRS